MVASFFKVFGLRMAVFKVGRVEKYPAVRNRSSKVAIVEIALMRIGVRFVAVFAVVFVALLYIVWKCIEIWLFIFGYSMRINEDYTEVPLNIIERHIDPLIHFFRVSICKKPIEQKTTCDLE